MSMTEDAVTLLQQGLALHRGGNLAEAEPLYRQALAVTPDDPDGIHLLGLLLTQSGHRDQGIALIRRALVLQPGFPAAWLSLGNALLEAGALEEAVEALRQAVALAPTYGDALTNLGVALKRLGRTDEAIDSLQRAIAASPGGIQAQTTLGNLLLDLGRFQDAARCYLQALARQPDHAEIYHNLGLACFRLNRQDEAIAAYRAALGHRPDFPEALANLGACLRQQALWEEAEAVLLRALALQPDGVAILDNLAGLCRTLGRTAEALEFSEKATALAPNDATILFNLGTLLEEMKQDEAALGVYDQVIRRDPRFATAHYNSGLLLGRLGRTDAADAAYRRAIAIDPQMPQAWLNLGVNLLDANRPAEAVTIFRHILTFAPDSAEAKHNLGFALLLDGQLEEGFRYFEWRWEVHDYPKHKRGFAQPQWDGQPFAGQTLLVHAEQGFGDTLQFCHLLPEAARRGGRVVLEVPPALASLLGTPDNLHRLGVAELVVRDQPLPPFDLQLPVLSLGRALGLTLDRIPADSPYLLADPARIANWQGRLALQPGLNIGLVWSGNPAYPRNPRRALALEQMAPLAAADRPDHPVRFYSLQKGPPEEQLQQWCGAFSITAVGNAINDFADLAAVMTHLDLIITSDTAAAHLAGALGRPVWTLLSFSADWRWLLDRPTSPWYPSMRLYRQPSPGDWPTVVAAVAADLARL